MTGWKPIATAPRDGTPVLLAGGHDDNAHYAPGHLQSFMRLPCRAMWDKEDGWLITLAEGGCVSVTYDSPTHWMLMPGSPETN